MTLPGAANAWTGRPSQEQLRQFSRGMMAQTFSIDAAAASGALTSGTIYGALLPVYGGDVLSGLAFAVQTAGTSTAPTSFFLGITDLTGVLLALTADSAASTTLTSTGVKSLAFATAYTVPANSTGCVYACVIEVGAFAGTALQILARVAVTGIGGALGSNAAGAVTQTGQTTIPNPATLTANNVYPWLALV